MRSLLKRGSSSGRIVGAEGRPRTAADDAPRGAKAPRECAVADDGSRGVVAAGGPEAALDAEGGQVRRDRRLVEMDAAQQQAGAGLARSEEHTSELQSPDHLVCRLLLEKKKIKELLR